MQPKLMPVSLKGMGYKTSCGMPLGTLLALPAQQHPTAPYPHFTERDSCCVGITGLDELLRSKTLQEVEDYIEVGEFPAS